MTLRSIAAQEGVRFECIVVEQDVEPRIRDRLPVWVRYVQTPPPSPEMPYCRSWAFNVAAREARGRVLICHDNDLLVPAAYAAEHIRVLDGGFDVANLKRFIFYLTQASTTRASQGKTFGDVAWSVDAVMQNAQGGGSIAISRQAYERIGGFDEEFIGWGGEDNDFWDRCQSLRVHPYGHLPLVHIWHPSQPRKQDAANPTLALFAQRRSLPMAERIARLRAAHQGLLTGPAGVRERNDEAMKRGGEEGSTSVRR